MSRVQRINNTYEGLLKDMKAVMGFPAGVGRGGLGSPRRGIELKIANEDDLARMPKAGGISGLAPQYFFAELGTVEILTNRPYVESNILNCFVRFEEESSSDGRLISQRLGFYKGSDNPLKTLETTIPRLQYDFMKGKIMRERAKQLMRQMGR